MSYIVARIDTKYIQDYKELEVCIRGRCLRHRFSVQNRALEGRVRTSIGRMLERYVRWKTGWTTKLHVGNRSVHRLKVLCGVWVFDRRAHRLHTVYGLLNWLQMSMVMDGLSRTPRRCHPWTTLIACYFCNLFDHDGIGGHSLQRKRRIWWSTWTDNWSSATCPRQNK